MQDFFVDFYKNTNVLDILYLVITIFTLIGCYKRGFVLSILSMAKWFLAYIITLIIFPKAKPYLKGIIDNEYVLDIVLGVTIFVIVIFLILICLLILRYKKNFLYKKPQQNFFKRSLLFSSLILWVWYTPRFGSLYGWVYDTSIGDTFDYLKNDIPEFSSLFFGILQNFETDLSLIRITAIFVQAVWMPNK